MDRRSFNRRVLMSGAAAAASASLAPEAAAAHQRVKTMPAGGGERHIKLFAEQIDRDRMGYGIGNGRATIPGR